MTDDVIVEVEREPDEGIVVTVDEGVDDVTIPPPCAGCLSEATKHLPSKGIPWPEFPYCDTCVPPLPEGQARKQESTRQVLRWVFGIFGRMAAEDLHGQRGNAVKFLHSESGTIRLAFRNEEYARQFVVANGGVMPAATAEAGREGDHSETRLEDQSVWEEEGLSD